METENEESQMGNPSEVEDPDYTDTNDLQPKNVLNKRVATKSNNPHEPKTKRRKMESKDTTDAKDAQLDIAQ